MNLTQPIPTPERSLEERIVSCLPAATFEMDTLCRLAGILPSTEVETAAVSCETRPRLLVNPEFVAEHCQYDEHLFLLVMHELYHVILGHTGLYPRPTLAHNIAFDAVINAGLCRDFPGAEYRGFFEAINPADTFPGLLLRPPEGWPHSPTFEVAGPPGTSQVLRDLYPPGDALDEDSHDRMPTYQRILDLLAGDQSKSRESGEEDSPFLLGNHSDPAEDENAMKDATFSEIVRQIVAQWPPPPFPLGGRDIGGRTRQWQRALGPCSRAARKEFANILRRVLGPRPGRLQRRVRRKTQQNAGLGVLPNPRDRLRPARRLLGAESLLWQQQDDLPARVPDDPGTALVYLDVSGSMNTLVRHLLSLLEPYARKGQAQIFQFSTIVEPLSTRDLVAGRIETTGGTDISPVFEHLLAQPKVKRALILTDGYTGSGRLHLAHRLRERNIALHIALPAEAAWLEDLRPLATSMTVLPSLWISTPNNRSL